MAPMSRGGLQKKTGLTKAVRPVKEATDED